MSKLRKQFHLYVKARTNRDGIFWRLPRLRLAMLRKQCHLYVKTGTNLDGILGRLPRLRLPRLRKQCYLYVKAGTNLDGILRWLPGLRLARSEKQCHLWAKSGTNLDGIFGKVAAPAPGEAAPREVLAAGVVVCARAGISLPFPNWKKQLWKTADKSVCFASR